MIDYNEFYLTLIRHGQSTTNQNPDLMGQEADTPLSDKGKLQAWHLGERLAAEGMKMDYVFSSTYTRAHDTAKIALEHFHNPPKIELVHDLREYSAGDWTGASRGDTLTTAIKVRMGMMAHGFLPPNGESLHQVERRASKWLEDRILYNDEMCAQALARKAESHAPEPINVVCFSHGMTIKCLLHYILGFDQSFTWKVTIDNTSITQLYFGKDGWRLITVNDHSHILGV